MVTITCKKIRAAMIFAGITQAQLARKEFVTRQAINHVITGRRRIPRLRVAIASALNIPMSIWDELDRELASKGKNP